MKHHSMKTWGSRCTAPRTIKTVALDRGKWSTSRPGRFILGETALGTHWIGGCVGPRTVWME